jgi:inhibitor of KinA sporulation pathway (predicted exonuclease)
MKAERPKAALKVQPADVKVLGVGAKITSITRKRILAEARTAKMAAKFCGRMVRLMEDALNAQKLKAKSKSEKHKHENHKYHT